MEFLDVVGHRRMVRRFDQRRVPSTVIDRIIDVGRRAPSAGFSQGLELLVLDTSETVGEFWSITRDPEFGWAAEDVAAGPTVIVVPLPDPARYTQRYSQPDKIAFGMDEADTLAREVLGHRRRDGIDADAARRSGGRPRRLVLRHHAR